MPSAKKTDEQILEAVVAGPDEANRLFNVTGTADVALSVAAGENRKTETWTFLVGPIFARKQFYRAISTAALNAQKVNIQSVPAEFEVVINSVEADWDDESGRVEVRVEVFLTANAGTTINISQLRYWVAILAQM